MSDHVLLLIEVWLCLLEILLLIRIVIQGEYLLRMDRERLQLERDKATRETIREEERAKWRKEWQDRERTRRKSETKTSESNPNSESPSLTVIEESKSKTTNAKSAADLLNPPA